MPRAGSVLTIAALAAAVLTAAHAVALGVQPEQPASQADSEQIIPELLHEEFNAAALRYERARRAERAAWELATLDAADTPHDQQRVAMLLRHFESHPALAEADELSAQLNATPRDHGAIRTAAAQLVDAAASSRGHAQLDLQRAGTRITDTLTRLTAQDPAPGTIFDVDLHAPPVAPAQDHAVHEQAAEFTYSPPTQEAATTQRDVRSTEIVPELAAAAGLSVCVIAFAGGWMLGCRRGRARTIAVNDDTLRSMTTLAGESEADQPHIGSVAAGCATGDNPILVLINEIDAITEQTNLLALNASIEAAHAGEHGRSFGIIADDVRRLTKRAAKTTDRARIAVNQLRADTDAAAQILELNDEMIENMDRSAG